MPLYEYQCQVCENRFELIQKFSDPPAENCPVCGGAVRKLLSSPAIQFKGSGWYVTDYARKGAGEAGKGAKADAPASSSEDAKSTESGKSAKSTPSESPAGASGSKES
jgi:putative FmdB family regulatory protein